MGLVAKAIGKLAQDTEDVTIKSKGMERLNCADGLNGGCSHFCTNNKCSCPSCWTMGPDMKTCGPEPNKVAINCESSDIHITIDQCVLQGGHIAKMQLVPNLRVWSSTRFLEEDTPPRNDHPIFN